MQIASAPISSFVAPLVDPVPVDPSRAVYDRHVRDIMSLPGAQRTGWSKANPGEVHIVFANDGFKRLADNVLRDVIDGVKLVLKVDPAAPAPIPGGDSWADNPNEMARAVSAMPGIFGAAADGEHGVYTYTFSATDPAVAARLKPLISEHFGRFRTSIWARPLPKPPA